MTLALQIGCVVVFVLYGLWAYRVGHDEGMLEGGRMVRDHVLRSKQDNDPRAFRVLDTLDDIIGFVEWHLIGDRYEH